MDSEDSYDKSRTLKTEQGSLIIPPSNPVSNQGKVDIAKSVLLLQGLQNLETSQQENLINQWINNNIIVEKRLFMCARQGNIKDEYFFERKVGSGGFGVVYSAKNRLTR